MEDLRIEQAENGFILRTTEDTEDGSIREVKIVIEEDCSENELTEEQYTMTRLLEEVAKHFGIIYNKFSKDNLNISWDKKGHKVE